MSRNIIELNGVHVLIPAPTIDVHRADMPNSKAFSELRADLESEWFLYLRQGVAYGMPRVATPSRRFGAPCQLRCEAHPQFLAALALDRIRQKLEQLRPQVLRRRPFLFVGQKDELVQAIRGRLRSVPPILDRFKIRRRFQLNTKLIEPREGATSIGLFMSLGTRWDIEAPLDSLARAGIELQGLAVVRRSPEPDERRLLGRIARIDGRTVQLTEGYDGLGEVSLDVVWLEGSRAAFAFCLRSLLASEYDQFETERRLAESEFLGAAAFDQWIETMAKFLRERFPRIDLGGGASAEIGDRVALTNTPEHRCVTAARPVEYCFDRARTKRSALPWPGLQKFGPFGPLARRTPRIAVLFPDVLQGPTENFIELLRQGVTSVERSVYPSGIARVLDLVNPQFPLYPFRWIGRTGVPISERYRLGVETILADRSTPPDAAIVVIPDECSRMRNAENPYLHAKAALLMAGVPVQSVKESTLRQRPSSLQYTLQNFVVALAAKLHGIPWTVEQDLTVSDEIVIGLGSCSVSGSRFDRSERFVGITTVFRGDGSYILSNLSDACSYEEYPQRLRQTTTTILEEVRHRNGWQHGDTVRIIVHAFKPLRDVEAADVIADCMKAVRSEQQVQFAFVTVSHDHEFTAFDRDQRGLSNSRGAVKGVLVPDRGVIVEIGRNTRLVNVTGPSLTKRPGAPIPRPILVSLHPRSDYGDRHYLAEQVLRFTSLSWRSLLPSREPVTISYSEMIARELTRLREIPGWNIEKLNSSLRTSCWFL
ncbi:MAG: stem cell self-renewal protein Piwi domain-containing protein [Myxococcaceae bacterium]|nr:MAG: stem cell self-renewal protein Piwi domain-containing protein [Myxococcaceae bacterium]